MAPKGKLTAALFQEQYGNLVSEHFAQYTTPHTLRVALSQRKPPIIVTDGMLKIWFAKFRLPSDAVTVSSAEELHGRYGDLLPALADFCCSNPTCPGTGGHLADQLTHSQRYLVCSACAQRACQICNREATSSEFAPDSDAASATSHASPEHLLSELKPLWIDLGVLYRV